MRDRSSPSFKDATLLGHNPRPTAAAPPAYLPALLALAALAAVLVIATVPFSLAMPDYWTDAQQLVQTGRVLQHFTPSGYPAELAAGMKLLPARRALGVEVLQAFLQVATTAAAWWLLLALQASAEFAFAGALTVALHPALLVTVVKVWDVGLSTLLLLLLLLACFDILRRGLTPTRVGLLGALWAFGIFDRPNYLALLPALLFVLECTGRPPGSRPRGARLQSRSPSSPTSPGMNAFVAATALVLVTACTYCTLSLAVYRTVLFPGNGPYNLYAGQNSFSESALLHHLNAELAVAPALLEAHMPQAAANSHDLALRPYFTHASLSFAATHPATELRLVGIKLYTLLRADTKLHPTGTFIGDIELAMTLPVPVWILTLILTRNRSGPWTAADTLICLVALLYTLPFLLTNSDPRFRMPLDAIAIVHTAALLSRANSVRSRSSFAPAPTAYAL